MRFLPGVNEGVLLQSVFQSKGIVALWAVVRFLPCVNEGVALQIAFLSEGFVALRATEHLELTVDLLMKSKATSSFKCLRAGVTSYLVLHLLL